MKTDMYTKTVLTVIAISLATIALKESSLVKEARAQTLNDVKQCWDEAKLRKDISGDVYTIYLAC